MNKPIHLTISQLVNYPDLKSKTAWRTEGFKIKKEAEPFATTYNQYAKLYYLYDKASVEKITRRLAEKHKEKMRLGREKSLTCIKCGSIQNHYTKINNDKICLSCQHQQEYEERMKIELEYRNKLSKNCQEWLNNNKYLIIDTETTGLDDTDQIIELAIINTEGEVIYHSLLNPTCEINPEAAQVHGISKEDLRDKPTFKDEWSKIKAIIENKTLLAYNSKFDIRLLKQTIRTFEGTDEISIKEACVMRLFNDYIDSQHWISLSRACDFMDIEIKNNHRAIDDCLLTLELIKCIARNEQSN